MLPIFDPIIKPMPKMDRGKHQRDECVDDTSISTSTEMFVQRFVHRKLHIRVGVRDFVHEASNKPLLIRVLCCDLDQQVDTMVVASV